MVALPDDEDALEEMVRYTCRSAYMYILHVESAEPGIEYGILFIFSLFCEYAHHEYARIHVIYRV